MTTTKKSHGNHEVKATETGATDVATASEKVAVGAALAPAVTTASSLADRVKQALVYFRMAIAILALNPPAMTASERKLLGKFRRGGERFIPQIAQMAQEWSVQLRTQPIEDMNSALDVVTTLQPVLTLLVGFVQELEDIGAQSNSVSWGTASALYSVLKRMSRKDPKLKAQLAPVAEFFKSRRPKTEAEKEAAAQKAPAQGQATGAAAAPVTQPAVVSAETAAAPRS